MNLLPLSVIQRSFSSVLRNKINLLGVACFYGIILFIFSKIWATSEAKDPEFIFNRVDMVWYLTVTEWIMISVPMIHSVIAKDIQDESFSYFNLKPYPYIWLKAYEGLGELFARMFCLGAVGLGMAFLLTGQWPSHPSVLLWVLPLGILSAIVGFLFCFAIGLTTFWLWDPGPLFWVWQKALFVLGGLIFPLAVYPDWLAAISRWTPCSAILHGPAHLLLTPSGSEFFLLIIQLCFWGCVAVAFIYGLNFLGMMKIGKEGG